MGDQHQGGGGEEGGRSAIGGVAPEQLAKARVGEVAAEDVPECVEGAKVEQTFHAPQPDPLAQTHRTVGGPGQEGVAQGVVNTPRMVAEVEEAPRG